MRVRNYNIQKILLYPIIINPVMWLIVAVGIVNLLLFGWWSFEVNKSNRQYRDFKLIKPKKAFNSLFYIGMPMLLNCWFWNSSVADAYATYLQCKWLENDGSYQHQQSLKHYKFDYERKKIKRN